MTHEHVVILTEVKCWRDLWCVSCDRPFHECDPLGCAWALARLSTKYKSMRGGSVFALHSENPTERRRSLWQSKSQSRRAG